MIGSAAGERLPLGQDGVTLRGHAIEVRINAEDPAADFMPQTGTITHLVVPSDARWDSGVIEGSVVSPFYDPMLAKVIVFGVDRPAALTELRRALDGLVIGGVVTNSGFHRWLVDQDPLIAGRITTRFLDETDVPTSVDFGAAARIAAASWDEHVRSKADAGPWASLPHFSTTPHRMRRSLHLEHHSGEVIDVDLDADVDADHGGPIARATRRAMALVRDRAVAVNVGGYTHTFRVVDRTEAWTPAPDESIARAGAVVSPFPAVVTEMPVAAGDEVQAGDVVAVIEAMKMLHSLPAAGRGIVADVRVAVGDLVQTNQVLVTFEEHPA
jgi:3-methylcrotonyl-CoA carboxylase alpha subunit